MAAAGGTGPGGAGGPAPAGDAVAPPSQAVPQGSNNDNTAGVGEAGGPASAGVAVPEHNGIEGTAARIEMGYEADPMLEALLKTMTTALAEGTQSTNNLFTVSGCTVKDVPARVTSTLLAAPGRHPGLRAGSAFDLHGGRAWGRTTS